MKILTWLLFYLFFFCLFDFFFFFFWLDIFLFVWFFAWQWHECFILGKCTTIFYTVFITICSRGKSWVVKLWTHIHPPLLLYSIHNLSLEQIVAKIMVLTLLFILWSSSLFLISSFGWVFGLSSLVSFKTKWL